MTARTYRVQAIGQFADLTPALKGQLLDELADHDLLDSAAEADAVALVEGELLAADFLESRGLTHKPLNVSAVCLQDVKIKRRR